MVTIVFSYSATNDLKEIYEYYKSCGDNVAMKLVRKIRNRINILVASPLAGKVETGYEEFRVTIRTLIIGKRYKVLYHVDDEFAYILAIWDCRQKPDSLFYKLNKLLK